MLNLVASDIRRSRLLWLWMLVAYAVFAAVIAAMMSYLVGYVSGHGNDTTTDSTTAASGITVSAPSAQGSQEFATEFMEADGKPGQSLELPAVTSPFGVLLLTALFLSVFAAEDFSTGFIRGLLPAGISRWRYYAGKMVTTLVVTFVYTMLFLALVWVFMRLAGFGFRFENPGRHMVWAAFCWLLLFVYVLICCVVTWLFQSRLAGVITAFVVAGGLLNTLISTLGNLLHSQTFDAIVQWLPHSSLTILRTGDVSQLFQSSLDGITLAPLAHVGVTVAVSIAVLLAMTLLVLPHRDIH